MHRDTVRMLFLSAALILSAHITMAGSTERATAAFAEGKELMQQGQFDAALKAYAQAAKNDPENQSYRQEYHLLRQIIKMRKRLEKESNIDKWVSTASGLRQFYNTEGLYNEALAIDKMGHEKLHTTESALQLAHSLLATEKPNEAAALLVGLGDSAPVKAKILLGIAHAQQNSMDLAKAVAATCKLDDNSGPDLAYNLACLQSLTGNKEAAIDSLARAFAYTPPSRQSVLKEQAGKDKNLVAIASLPNFAKALETESKIKESSCSGGTSCGKCPSRDKCGTSSSSKTSQ